MAEKLEPRDASPESAAITGGVPAGAEPSPQTRGREATARSSTYIYLLFGVVLLLTALLADQSGNERAGTALAGVGLLAIGAMAITGYGGPATVAVLGFGAGVLVTIVAFATGPFDYLHLMLLVTGAATFIVSFASLAATRRPAQGDDEPGAGVENV